MRYVVLGASTAGMNGVRELRRHDPQSEIILVSKDREIYSRCILHHYLGGIRDKEGICFAEPDFEAKYRVKWYKGMSCTGLDAEAREVIISGSIRIPYDRLLIATGSRSSLPPVEGLGEAGGVYGFHNLDEVEQIKARALAQEHIVVMGGGLTGVDAAMGFLHMGKKVELVEVAERLLVKQLDKRSASTYEKALEDQGIRLHLGTGSRVCCGADGNVASIQLSDGQELPCTMLVVTAGVRPNVDFLEGTGVELDRFGLVIDSCGRTNIPEIFGAGDVTGRSPIWPAAVKQAVAAAANMTGHSMAMDDFFASKSTMNFLGIPTMSLGIPVRPDDTYCETVEDTGEQYRKIIHKEGRIYGAILQGDLSYGGVLTQLIARRIDVSRVRKPLFRIDYSDFFHEKDNFEFYYDEVTR
ncbi:MAG: FAD-dependent oxidoreductase [Clostridia bacterium]|nr:FAD-dependent oxidoreductase [Clostridia bacterium]